MAQCTICGNIVDENGDEEQLCEDCQLSFKSIAENYFGYDEHDTISDDL